MLDMSFICCTAKSKWLSGVPDATPPSPRLQAPRWASNFAFLTSTLGPGTPRQARCVPARPASFYEGRKLGESMAQIQARQNGTAPAALAASAQGVHTEAMKRAPQERHGQRRMVPIDRINLRARTRRFIARQQYHKNILAELANARAAASHKRLSLPTFVPG